MKGCVCCGILLYIHPRRIPRANVSKTDIYWGLYRIHVLVFVDSLLIFLPHLEVRFFNNIYFLVSIFYYRTIMHIFIENPILFLG